MQSLAVKYRPKTFEDTVEQSVVKDILLNHIKENKIRNTYLFCGSSGCGKAQPLDSDVLTPNGFVKMKDIKCGSEVITHTGSVAVVSGVFNQGVRDVYEICFNDKTSIRVADNHLNCIYTYNGKRKGNDYFVIETRDLIKLFETSKKKLRVEIPTVPFSKKEIPIDPYLVGFLLGDGNLCGGSFGFSNNEKDVIDKVSDILSKYDCDVKYRSKYDYRISGKQDNFKNFYIFNNITYKGPYKLIEDLNSIGYPKFDQETIYRISTGDASTTFGKYPELFGKIKRVANDNYSNHVSFRDDLRNLGICVKSTDKFIPKEYLLNDIDTRLELLRGLFDSDGYTSENGVTEFSTSSKQLSDDFSFLVRSLGCRDTVTSRQSNYINKDGEKVICSTSYRHHVKFPNNLVYCSSEKHLRRRKKRQSDPIKKIVAIKYVGKEECQCIYVDHEDHTYITDNFVPTHNTTLARTFANSINSTIVELDAASHNGVEDMKSILNQARSKPIGTDYRVFLLDEAHNFSKAAWEAALKSIEEPVPTSVFIFCSTDPQKFPKTILSRVQRYDFKRISHSGVVNRLKFILDSENNEGHNYTYTEDAIDYIAKLSEGGMRDAITLMEKALGYSDNLTLDIVTKALGSIDYSIMFELTDSLYNMNKQKVIEIIETIHRDGIDLKQFINEYNYFVLDLCKYDVCRSFEFLKLPTSYEDKMKSYTKEHYSFFSDLLNAVMKLNTDIKWESTPKPMIESQFILLCSEG